jgi:hypothetical protein
MTKVKKDNETITHKSSFTTVSIADLKVDPEAQRKVSMVWVKAHIENFDVDLLGYIVVNKRANGHLYIIDGQHRVELMRAVGWADQKIHAELFDGLNQAQEAELFNARNDRKSVKKYDKFRISVTAKDPQACHITEIVQKHGMIISDQLRPGNIVAVDALERIYKGAGIASGKDGPAALAAALRIAVQAWGKQTASVNGTVLLGLGMVHLRYNGKISEKELIAKLSPLPGGAPGLLGKGRSMQELHSRPLHHCVASIIVDRYNAGRKSSKIERWES